jgi:hypothetical protein
MQMMAALRNSLIFLALAVAMFALAATFAPLRACPGTHCPTLP